MSISIYPLLKTSTISPNILPGLCKALERFILIYEIDFQISPKKKKSIKKEDLELFSDNDFQIFLSEQAGHAAGGAATVPATTSKGPKNPANKRPGKTTVDMPNFTSLSVEPTWVKIDSAEGTKSVGIKVVPFTVKSDEQFIELLTNDVNIDTIDYLIERMKRAVIRKFFYIHRNFPFTKKGISGDPLKDIIWQKSEKVSRLFCACDIMDLKSDEFLTSSDKVRRLNNLGWRRFIVTDNVNKRAFFCMKEFGGLCSVVQYSFLYSTLGAEKTFSGLEDARRSSSPFFNKMSGKLEDLI